MSYESERKRLLEGKLYCPFKILDDTWNDVHKAQKEFNESEFWHDNTAFEKLKKCFGSAPDDLVLIAPVYFNHGDKVFFGKHFFANAGLTILDENEVRFGNDVMLGPNCNILAASHPTDAVIRREALVYALPVTIGNDVWIGGNVTINQGVTIGDEVIIGSGSVVTKNIPSHTIAAGNPCKVIRELTDEDKKYWEDQLKEYQDYCKEEESK